MKPIKLVMEGFGSYREHTEIDFAKLDRGLYLITGPTGSGKTTIFDAIAYALYGDASGSLRTAKGLRNKSLDDNDACYVELEFTYTDKKYKVRRSPAYRKSTNKNETPGTAELMLPDGEVITGAPVNAYIIDNIMHLTKDQFLQISMLAQGEFQKMLISKTEDKMNIFRHIFDTSLYETLTTRLGNDKSRLTRELESLDALINEELKRIPEVSMGEEVDEELQKVKERGMSMADSIDSLNSVLDALVEENEEKCKTYELLGHREIELDREVNNLRSYNAVMERISRLEKILPDAEVRAAKAAEELKIADEKNGAYKAELIVKENDNSRKIEAIRDLHKQRKAIDRDAAIYETRTSELHKLEEDRGDVEKRLKDLEVSYAAIQDNSDEKVAINSRIGECRTELSSLQDATVLESRLERARESEGNAQKVFLDARDSYSKARAAYENAYDIFYSQQAGILASSLEEGTPCPVCGSIHHPNLAELKDSKITDAELKRREKIRKEEEKRFTEASIAASTAVEKVETAEAVLSDSLRELGIDEDEELDVILSDRMKTIHSEIASLNERLEEINRDVLRKSRMNSEIEELKVDIDERRSVYETLKTELSSLSGNLSAREEVYEAEKGKLGDIDEMALLEETSRIRKEIQAIESRFRQVTSDKSRLDSELQEIRTNLASEKERQKTFRIGETDEAVLADTLREVKQSKSVVHDRQLELNTDISELKTIIANLGKSQKQKDGLEEEASSVTLLFDAFSGKIKGKEKVSLETYVQMAYFDRIIDKASKRLMAMTAKRYELKREQMEDIDLKNKQKGLDLLVLDHNEGNERPVGTLSGGEKFLASLCLALGLSDEIEEEAGGVHLDSIFIDEGFGSLDSDSLSLAMNALEDLAEGEKLVGIISHVEALQTRIDKKIQISKGLNGESYAEIIL